MQNQIEKIREYYREANLFLIYNPNWRFYTFKLLDGSVKRFHIHSIEDLRKLLVKYHPLVAYHSQGQWLNVQNVRGKRNPNFRIKLQEDLIFDIDSQDMEQARLSALEIIKRLGESDYIIMTRRGFHICYYKVTNKKEMINKVRGVKDLDIKCSENEFGVFSIPLTLNKSGKVNIFITKDQLNLPISQLQALQPQIYIPCDNKETSERRKPMKQSSQETDSSSWSKVNGEGTGTEGTVLLSFNNKVNSHLFIPILIYPKTEKINKVEELANHYDLGNLYVFQNKENLCFISLKCMERRRLEKLLNSSDCLNKYQFFKLKKIWFDFSEYKPFVKVKLNTNKNFMKSIKHEILLKSFGFNTEQDKEILVGNDKIRTYEVKMI